jgi:hypothetical protein
MQPKDKPSTDDAAEDAEQLRRARTAHGFGFHANYPFPAEIAAQAGPTCKKCGCWIRPGDPCRHCDHCAS